MSVTAIDRALIAATQEGLPLVPKPFAAIAESTGLAPDVVEQRFAAMLDEGIIRRIAAVPNHYALGLGANGMTVWDVDDSEIARLGAQVGALDFVTHCYRRPRVEGLWSYNLLAMVHGNCRDEVEAKAAAIAELLGPACRARDTLYSTRILKKAGFRLQD
jgi:DNA-binding Lrp family transcriptional regulator